MKRLIPLAIAVAAPLFLSGCLALDIGGGGGSPKREVQRMSLGQELIDLKSARDAGAITDAEFEAQKAKLLKNK